MNDFNKLAKIRRQAGLTLVELSIALAIGAVITIVGIIFAQDALKESRISSESARINSIVMKSRAAFQNSSYATIGTDPAAATVAAAQLGVFPNDMLNTAQQTPSSITAANQIANRWGGNPTVAADGGLTLMSLVYPNIPQEDCVELVNRVQTLFTHIGAGTVANLVTNAAIKNADTNTVYTPATAAAACAAGSNTITFGFRK